MQFKQYLYISNFLNTLLKNTQNDEGVFLIPWLHFLRVHKSENRNSYDFKNQKLNILPYKLLLFLLKSFYGSFFYKKLNFNNDNNNDNDNYDDVYISHIITRPAKNQFKDFYFPNEIKNKNSITLLINHTHIPDHKIKNLLQGNFYLLSKHSSLKSSYSFLIKSLKSHFKLKGKIKSQKNNC